MTQFKKRVLVAALATAVGGGVTTTANAAAISSLYMNSGQFAMGVFTPAPNTITYFNGANLIGSYNAPAWNTSTAQTSAAPSSLASFDFNGGGTWVNTYTAASATQSGVAGGGPAPSGTVVGNNITVDLSSFFANWNGTDFSQGTSAATGTVSNVSGNSFDYTLSWTSLIVGGAFNGQTGTWTVSGTGTVSAVPVPAAAYLFGSGLIGLVGVARRRRAKA